MEKTKLSKYLTKCYAIQRRALKAQPEKHCYVNVFNFDDGGTTIDILIFDNKIANKHIEFRTGTYDWYTEDDADMQLKEFIDKAKEEYGI